MNSERLYELPSVTFSARKVGEPGTRCTVCYCRREIVANGRTYRLPLSGEPVTKKLESWWTTSRSRNEECPFENLSMIPELAMCERCLDLVTQVEEAEYGFRDFLEVLWTRITASEVLCGQVGSKNVNDENAVVGNGERKSDGVSQPPLAASALMEFSMTTGEEGGNTCEELANDFDASELAELVDPLPVEPSIPVKEENCFESDSPNTSAVGSIVIQRREPACLSPPPSPRRSDRPVRRVAEVARKMIRKSVEEDEDYHPPIRVKVKLEERKTARFEQPKPSSSTVKAKKILRKIINPQKVKAIAAQGQRTKNHTIVASRLPRKTKERKPRTKKDKPENGKSSDPPSRVCPICGVMLKGSDCTLKKHISYVHHKEKVLECQFCDEKFEYHGKLYVHQAKAHNHRPERIMEQCELCGKVVRAKWCMKEHLLTVHGIEPEKEKVYCCDKCPKRYICLNKYKDHLNSHEGIRPYACPLCNVRMVRIDNLRQHAKRVHQRELKWRRRDDGVELVEVA